MRRIVLLVIAESVVLVLLALQWTGSGRSAATGNPPPLPADTAPRGSEPAAAVLAVATAPRPDVFSAVSERSAAPATALRFDANDPIGIVVSGTIRGSDGALVDGASVYLRREGEGRSGYSAAPGCYAVAGLQPGEWTLTCRAEGYAPHEAPCVLDERPFQQIDVTLHTTYVVRVKVLTGDGKPLAPELPPTSWSAPYVVATESPLTEDLPPTEHARVRLGIGEWQDFHGIHARDVGEDVRRQGYAGELRLHRAPPAYASLLLRTALLQSQRIEPGQKEVVFRIEVEDVLAKHGTVRLRVVHGETRSPIADAVVTVRSSAGGGSRAKTDAEGRASIGHVEPGLCMLELERAGDREAVFRYVSVPAGGTVDLGDVVLTASEKIAGAIVDADGKPVTKASVQWTELDSRSFPQPLVDHRSSSTDTEGKFLLWACGRHRYVVFARNGEDVGFATADATQGAPPPLTITMGKATRVALKPRFDAAVGYVVTALAKDGSPVAVASLGPGHRPDVMLLPPGQYTIEIHDMKTHRLARSLDLHVGSEPLTVDVP